MWGKSCCFVFGLIISVLIGGIWLGFATRTQIEISTLRIMFSYIAPNQTERIAFPLNETQEILKHPEFNVSKPTVFLIHGYHDTIDGIGQTLLRKNYFKRNDHNILSLDWGDLAKGNLFFDTVPNINRIAPIVSKVLLELFEVGLDCKKLHFVTVAAGTPLGGLVGRKIIEQTNGEKKIKRITALDPTFLPFSFPAYIQIKSSDAVIVDVIHTDAGLYGVPYSLGSADFWPNGGESVQPGCPTGRSYDGSPEDTCSHDRAVLYYAESLIAHDSFNSLKCPSWKDFKANNRCVISDIVHMGIDLEATAKGDYYLQTSTQSPFSKDNMDGAYYSRWRK